MRNLLVLLIILLGFTLAVAVSPEGLPNLQQPRYQVFTSGQPTEDGFRNLTQMGVRTVINVLPDKDCIANEQQMVSDNGMLYIRLPFQLSGFRKETMREFGKLLKDVEKPVLIHCYDGNHVGGLWFAYRVMEENAPLGQALKEGRKIGMKPDLEDSLFDWLLSQPERTLPGQQVGK